MNLKTNGNGNGRTTPWLRIVVLVVAAVLIVFLAYRQIDRFAGPKRTVWVPTVDLEAGSVVTGEDLEARRLREKRLPQGAVDAQQPIAGRQLQRTKAAGSPFVAADFAAGTEDPGSISRLVPAGRVLMTVRVDPRSVPFPELRRGDRLNIVAVLPDGSASGSVADDAYFLGWIQPRPSGQRERATVLGVDISPPGQSRSDGGISLLLALRPEHVLPLSRAQASGARLDFVLHGRSEVEDGELLVLPRRGSPARVEVITGGSRETMEFAQ